MIKIGVTGGIGSGKTLVCRIFGILGVPVYYADAEARRIMEEDPDVTRGIRARFGEEAYDASGRLDRRYMAERVFGNPEKLQLLNSLVHPATIRDSDEWARRQQVPYVMKEAALLFETEAFHHVDKVLGIYAPRAVRMARAMRRDGLSREEVQRRMDSQLNETIKMRLSDYLIDNDDVHAVLPQVLRMHGIFLELAGV